MYEYLIIGAGIAGLYTAYKLKKANKHVRFLVLEKNARHDIGGRVGTDLFYGAQIVTIVVRLAGTHPRPDLPSHPEDKKFVLAKRASALLAKM